MLHREDAQPQLLGSGRDNDLAEQVIALQEQVNGLTVDANPTVICRRAI